jgi:hypothetical protein
MAAPTPTSVRDLLEGYGITTDVLTDAWITARMTNFIIPAVENITRQKFDGITSVTEYHSGTGKNTLFLDRRPIVAVTEIAYVLGGNTQRILNLAMIETVANQGILKAKTNYDEAFLLPLFAKGEYNIKVTYNYGYADYPADIAEAVIYLTAEVALGQIGARTGGGSISLQGWGRNFGDRGRYTDIRNDLARMAHSILSKYSTRVVGS